MPPLRTLNSNPAGLARVPTCVILRLSLHNSDAGLEARTIGAEVAPLIAVNATFFMGQPVELRSTAPSMAGRVGRSASSCRFLLPVFQPCTSCHPHLEVRSAGSHPVQ